MPRRPVVSLAVGVVVLALAASAASAAFLTRPTVVLQYVPFAVTDPSTSLSRVRVMQDANCATSIAGGSAQTLSSGEAIFTITAADERVYLCDADTPTLQREIVISPMTSTPVFAFRSVAATLTYTAATPVGAGFRLMNFASCDESATPMASGTLNSLRQVTISATSSGFKCLTVTAEATGQQVTVNTGRLLVTEVIGFSPSQVIVSDLVNFQISGAAPLSANVRISRAADCSDATVSYTAGGSSGYSISTTVNFARGSYEFCVEISPGVFASAGALTVLKYSATPTTALRTRETVFTLTEDSPRTTVSRITASSDCSNVVFNNLLASPSSGALQPVTFTSLGTFFVCVRTVNDANKFINAATVSVVPPADIFFTPDPLVRGLLTEVRALPDAAMTLRLTTIGDCTNIHMTLQTTNNLVSFVMPTSGSTANVDTLQVCVVTADNSAVYPIRTVTVRNFRVNHEAMIAGTGKNLTLDTSVAIGTTFVLSTAADCSASTGTMYTVAEESRTVYVDVPDAATYHVCIRNTLSVTSNVGSFVVNPVPRFTPNASLTQQPTPVTITDTIAGAAFTIGTTCVDGILATGVSGGATYTLTATFPSNGAYQVCASYKTSDGRSQVFGLGTIAVADMTSAPRFHVANVESSLLFSIPNADPSLSADINTQFFLTTAANCGTVATDTTRIFQGVATFTPTATGTFTVCVQTIHGGSAAVIGSAPYIPGGTIEVVDAPAAAVVESYAPIHGIPFRINMTSGSIPTGWVVTSVADQCTAGTLATGLFSAEGVSVTRVALAARTASYSLCVRSPDGASLLWARNVQASKFTSRVTSLVEAQPATVATTPTLSGGFTFKYFLSVNSDCAASNDATYDVATGAQLTAPSGTYALCATDANNELAFVSDSTNNISVIEVFSATLPDDIRGMVPTNITISSDNTDRIRVYLLRNTSQPCNLLTDVPLVGFTGADRTTVEITVPARTDVTVCAISNDGTVAMPVGNVSPLPYTIPSEIVKGTPTVIRSTGTRDAIVRFTTDSQCLLPVGPALRTLAGFEVQDVLIPASVTATALFYCEAPSLSDLTFRRIDSVGLLAPLDPDVETVPPIPAPPNSTWIPDPDDDGKQQPGVPFNLTVPPSVGTDPYLSRYSNCSDSVNYTLGIFPAEGEFASFFVCVTSPAGTLYTTRYPSMNFSNFVVEPLVVSTRSPTRVNLIPAVPRFVQMFRDGVYFARDSRCSVQVEGPFGTADEDVTFGLPAGRVWVCLMPDALVPGFVGVASFMLHAPPVATVSSERLLGVPICMDLAVPNNTWSVTSNVVGPSRDRRIYFVADPQTPADGDETVPCPVGQMVGSAVQITRNTSICLPTAGLDGSRTYAVCGPSPTGEVLAARGITFSTVSVSPRQLVFDADTPIHVDPNVSNARMTLNIAGSGCARSVAPAVTTDEGGNAILSIRRGVAFTPPAYPAFAAGTYELCQYYPATDTNYRVATVELSSPVVYSVSNTFITTLTDTEIVLEGDLTFDRILGFGTDAAMSRRQAADACANPTNTTPVIRPKPGDVRRAILRYDTNQNRSLYLCARAPVNNSAVPFTVIDFVRPLIEAPSAASACAALTLGFVREDDPRATSSETTVALYNRPCCIDRSYTLLSDFRVATALQTQSRLSMTILESSLDQFAPTNTFRLCVVNPELRSCVDLGQVVIGRGQCSTPASGGTNSTVDPRATLASGAFLGGAPPEEAEAGVVEISIVGGIFLLLLILLIVLCIVCAKRRQKVIPADEGDPEEPPTGEWRDTFDVLFEANRTKTPKVETLHSMLHVPVDLKLNTCAEQPVELQAVAQDEKMERHDIETSESFVFGRLEQAFRIESEEALEQTVLAERTALVGSVVGLWEQQFGQFMDVEEEARDVVKALEEERRLQVARLERGDWRDVMDVEGEALERNITREERWRSRKRRLMQSSAAMMGHLDPAAASAASPMPPDPTARHGGRQQYRQDDYEADEPEEQAPVPTTMATTSFAADYGSDRRPMRKSAPPMRADPSADSNSSAVRPSTWQSASEADAQAARDTRWTVVNDPTGRRPPLARRLDAPTDDDAVPGSLMSPPRNRAAAATPVPGAPRGTSMDTVDDGIYDAPRSVHERNSSSAAGSGGGGSNPLVVRRRDERTPTGVSPIYGGGSETQSAPDGTGSAPDLASPPRDRVADRAAERAARRAQTRNAYREL